MGPARAILGAVSELDDPKIEAALVALVHRVAPWAIVRFEAHAVRPPGHSWDGETLVTTGATYESAIHEIAHLLVTPPERRRAVEFGLGPDPYRRGFVPRLVPEAEADAEELDACRLQLLIVRLLGLEEERVMSEYAQARLTLEDIASLRARRPGALPDEWWARALGASS